MLITQKQKVEEHFETCMVNINFNNHKQSSCWLRELTDVTNKTIKLSLFIYLRSIKEYNYSP